jgi:hypothetical protein
MKRVTICLLLSLVWSGYGACQAQVLGWSRQLDLNEYQRGRAVSADLLGNVFIAGDTAARDSDSDGFLAKYDPSGQLQWTRLIQGEVRSYDEARGVSADGLGNVYVSGQKDVNVYLSKYSAAGDLAWSRAFEIPMFQTTTRGVSADALGNVFIAGQTFGPLNEPNDYGAGTFIAKYDSSGVLAWTRQLSPYVSSEGYGVSADGLGNVYLAGVTEGDLDGENAGDLDAFVAKYDASGALAWTRQLGTAGPDYSFGVSADQRGNIFVTGFTFGSLGGPQNGFNGDPYLAKYDATGALIWTRQFGSPETDVSYGVSADGLGNAYLTGYTHGYLDGRPGNPYTDAFLAKYNAAGTLEFTRQFGTGAYDDSRGVSADGLGNAYITGRLDGGDHVNGTSGGVAFVNKYQVPEPGTLALGISSLIGMSLVRRRERRFRSVSATRQAPVRNG